MILAFIVAVFATALGSDLHLPRALSQGLSIYLLLAIGFKGGTALAQEQMGDIVMPLLATVALGVITPLTAYAIARWVMPIGRVDASALAAHYGSVSVVTFAASLTVMAESGIFVEGYTAALLALLEIPGIIVALTLAADHVSGTRVGWAGALREAILGRSIVLLAGGLLIGWIAGPQRMEIVALSSRISSTAPSPSSSSISGSRSCGAHQGCASMDDGSWLWAPWFHWSTERLTSYSRHSLDSRWAARPWWA